MEGKISRLQGTACTPGLFAVREHARLTCEQTGKKKLKAVARALRNVERTPQIGGRVQPSSLAGSSTFKQSPFYTSLNHSGAQIGERRISGSGAQSTASKLQRSVSATQAETQNAFSLETPTPSVPIPGAAAAVERTPLHEGAPDHDGAGLTNYGSIMASPSASSPTWSRKDAPSLQLPGPALGPPNQPEPSSTTPLTESLPKPYPTVSNESANAYQVGATASPQRHNTHLAPMYRSMFQHKRINSMPDAQDIRSAGPPATKRMLSFRNTIANAPSQNDIVLNAYKEVDFRQSDFFLFLDKELQKVEDFYQQKENEATERLKTLREQLHIMRDKRVEELLDASEVKSKRANQDADATAEPNLSFTDNQQNRNDMKRLLRKARPDIPVSWLKPGHDKHRGQKTTRGTKTAQAMKELGTPSGPKPIDQSRDYVRRKKAQEVPYRTAKHKLKIALVEYYRGLELLKSYALLNRTAFRKINKKFDKTVNARPPGRYMSEKVNKAYFVESGVLETHIQAVEDLYARYFERGNHKIAVGKLRGKIARAGDYTASVFRNGLLLGIGGVFGAQGIVYGAQLTFSQSSTIAVHTSYLLQVSFVKASQLERC